MDSQKLFSGCAIPCSQHIGWRTLQIWFIPSNTDFQIFQKYGNLSGLDISFIDNGYVYHTKFDTIQRVPDGSIIRCAENLYTGTEALLKLKRYEMTSDTSTLVYYDFVGITAVYYSAAMANITNICVIILSALSIWLNLSKKRSKSDKMALRGFASDELTFSLLFKTARARLCAVVISLLTGFFISKFLARLNATMLWYSMPVIVIPLYAVPYVFIMVNRLSTLESNYPPNRPLNITGIILLMACQAEFTLYLAIWTCMQFQSSYIIMLLVLFQALGNVGRYFSSKGRRKSSKGFENHLHYFVHKHSNLLSEVLMHLLLLVPLLNFCYISMTVMSFMISLMGRIGVSHNPEFYIARLTIIIIHVGMAYIWPKVCPVSEKTRRITKRVTLVTVLAAVLLVAMSSISFPYREDQPKRLTVLHT